MEERATGSTKARPSFKCCAQGAVQLAPPGHYPDDLMRLLSETETVNGRVKRTTRCEAFHTLIRHYNDAFSFCSLGADINRDLANARGGSYTFQAHGRLYHRIGALQPSGDSAPAFAQLYIFDGEDEQLAKRGVAFRGLADGVSRLIQYVLRQHHPFIQYFQSNAERVRNDSLMTISIGIVESAVADPRRYYRPSVLEVAALVPNGSTRGERQLTLKNASGGPL